MAEEKNKVSLLHFTFQSLYFCSTPVEQLRGERFLTAVNQWYMPFVRTGWAVPLAFVIDVTTLLQRPSIGFKNRWKENVREDVKQLSLQYYRMLHFLRRQPVFHSVVELLQRTNRAAGRDQAIRTFVRFLLAELAHFRNTYSFDTRRLHLLKARPTADGIRDLVIRQDGKPVRAKMLFGDPARLKGTNEFGAIIDLITGINDYYSNHPLDTFITDAKRLMIEVAARTATGIGRIDYLFVDQLLNRADLGEVDEEEPRPRMVRKIVPTESYEIDGNVGGYIDVNRRRFTGSVAEILPTEMATFQRAELMYHKLLNEGALHFVREDVECIERELRLLFCFVIDTDERMMRSPADLHHSFGKGMTPYVRARSLASLLMMDLARYLPREDVDADFAVYMWAAKAKRTYCTEFDLFEAWSRDMASQRYTFAAELSEQVPHMFDYRVPPQAARENIALDRDPIQYIIGRSQTRLYHCRHLVFFTSQPSVRRALPDTDPALRTYDISGDSISIVYCDVNRPTLGISTPNTLHDVGQHSHDGDFGQLSEVRLRARIVETVLLKGAGKRPRTDLYETLSELP